MRRLIVNADDFGLTAGVNRGIVEAHQFGIVTSTTLMASGAAFGHAAQVAQSKPSLSVGCHVLLVDGSPLLSPGKVTSLLDPRHSSYFNKSISSFAVRAIAGRFREEEIQAEAVAQIRKLQSAGIAVSHVDTHKHAHIFPPVLRPLLKAASECGIRAIRNPFGRVVFSLVARHPALWKRYSQMTLLNGWAKNFRRAVAEAGMTTTDGSLGVVATGSLDEKLLQFTVETIPEGTWELVTHPGYDDADLSAVHTRLRQSRDLERQVLSSGTIRDVLQRGQIQLISYRDLR